MQMAAGGPTRVVWLRSPGLALSRPSESDYHLPMDEPDDVEESRFRRLVDTLDHAVVWEFDDTLGQYTFVSEHSRLVLGYAAEDWLQDSEFFERRIHPDDAPKLLELLAKLRRREAVDLRCEHRCRHADGHSVWVHTGVHFELFRGHRLMRGLTIDITHIKRAEEEERRARLEAERASKARDEVLAVVAHDLRNPLNTIRLGCEMLEHEPAVRQYSERILRAVDSMQRLIDDLVDAASIRASRLKLAPSEVDAATLVRQLAEDFAAEAESKGVSLRVLVGATATLRCDGRRLTQALANLMNNALKFTPCEGVVTLRLEIDALQAAFVVEDTGRGIAEDEIDKVFDREWQTDETAHLGSGMGLYIAKGIVMAQGGGIAVASQLGRGSTFTVTIPMT
jgi:PAS domain S-box-containing protein